MIRAPICTVVGHVDHGKTTLLDTLRGSKVAAGEAGAITQAIGASIVPIEHITAHAKGILDKQKITVPGLLFIDTPGHAAFSGMRKRGGSLADIAVLIVDINEGFKPQTIEALEILRSSKTPFIVAANKVDVARGYRKQADTIKKDLESQSPQTQQYLETKLYELVGTLAEHGMESERFDRVESFEKQVAIVPISALHGQGIDTLLALLVGLAQRYLEDNLDATPEGPARGVILEVTEEQGMGLTLNTIIYDGTLHVGDEIVVGTLREPVRTKVRALMQPADMKDMRDSKTQFVPVKQAVAATGVKIVAPGIEDATAGMSVLSADIKDAEKQVNEATEHAVFTHDEEGVIIKADNVGSLEALMTLLREKDVPVRSAGVGAVSKKDLARAASNEPEYAVILAFNVSNKEHAPEGVEVIESKVIYSLLDGYEEHQERVVRQREQAELASLARPAKFEVLEGCIFRASNPLVCGIHITQGTLQKLRPIAKASDPHNRVAMIKDIQQENESVQQAKKGSEVAISLPGIQADRHLSEGEVFWALIDEDEFRKLKQYKDKLTRDDIALIKEFSEQMREQKPLWGV